VALLWLGIVILLPTPEGTVKIELSDPQADVDIRVDGDDIHLEGLGEPLRLRTGDHQLVVTGQDFETVTRSFTVKRGKEEPMRITLIPKTPDSARPDTPETAGGEERPTAPQPAVYNVRVEPADGKLLVSGEGASVVSEGEAWTVTVARPDGTARIVLLATKSGYENQELELQPVPGESRALTLALQPMPTPPPPVPSVPITHGANALGSPGAHATPAGPTLTNSLGMKFALIPAGEFQMGSPDSDSTAASDEKPQHTVRITQPFYLGVTEVTQGQYERVMGTNPSNFKGAQLPVEQVSWGDAVEFCRKLSALPAEPSAGRVYRLPTEAEWEYSCRAGSTTKWSFGDDESSLKDHAWYDDNANNTTHPVGEKRPNVWGLYYMHGNVWEWCSDDKREYASTTLDDPTGGTAGSGRVRRGGGWDFYARFCRSAVRGGDAPGDRLYYLGFRVACSSVDVSGR
jgi:formylglycine-generating enzyme required for sulfatase activity